MKVSSVSYTHLDVYKRQLRCPQRYRRKVLRPRRRLTRHLGSDVYKRQHPDCAVDRDWREQFDEVVSPSEQVRYDELLAAEEHRKALSSLSCGSL